MGAEWWEYVVPFEGGNVADLLRAHKKDVLAATGDWSDVKIATKPGLFSLTEYPTTTDQVRILYLERDGKNLDVELGPGWELDDLGERFLDDLPRGQGFFEIQFHNDKPTSIKFCGYSCDSRTATTISEPADPGALSRELRHLWLRALACHLLNEVEVSQAVLSELGLTRSELETVAQQIAKEDASECPRWQFCGLEPFSVDYVRSVKRAGGAAVFVLRQFEW